MIIGTFSAGKCRSDTFDGDDGPKTTSLRNWPFGSVDDRISGATRVMLNDAEPTM
jgi:hypothetical protein